VKLDIKFLEEKVRSKLVDLILFYFYSKFSQTIVQDDSRLATLVVPLP